MVTILVSVPQMAAMVEPWAESIMAAVKPPCRVPWGFPKFFFASKEQTMVCWLRVAGEKSGGNLGVKIIGIRMSQMVTYCLEIGS